MSADDVIITVIQRLESLGLKYMIVGSYASNLWGRPRSSYDADVVVEITAGDGDRFYNAFSHDFVLERESLREDLERGTMFNLIPTDGMFKVDIIPRRRTDHAREEFTRRREVNALGHALFFASPEDTLLSKLAWHRKGGEVSGRQLEDARDVWATQGDAIDQVYLERWAEELGVRDLLEIIRGESPPHAPGIPRK